MASATLRWVIASANPGKQREVAQILEGMPLKIESLDRFGPISFPEEGCDYRDNAVAKARAVAQQIGEIAVADDSGIEVDALAGVPGPLSARYGGPAMSDQERVAKLLAAVKGVPRAKRTARFVCHAALATPDGNTVVAYGECRGLILDTSQGICGFGYDPIFQPDGYIASMAQIEAAEKNQISHRGQAIRDLYARWAGSADSLARTRD